MDNLLDKYLKEVNLNTPQFARIMNCNPGAVRNWRLGLSVPNATHAWNIHKVTKGKCPITFWGYTIINGKIRQIEDGPIYLEAK